ncbi:MAG: hypothetical protein PHX15_00610 [Candidatus Nanoarchaeia archaeon]|jgi:hypothetical protein|nr:hypothetical protein [Candidatus Nanoarchaeia archaeon]MDD3993685.1 hypothetical protein [Candidatus Nanoarchaeia archaeon]MDD4563665.1 hypothetical protein [Candidatus Nanoarchaeia archaeon]
MIIQNIFEGDFNDEVHNDFIKFSRGEFKDRYLIEAKKQTNKWSIKTSFEFTNSFVKSCLEKEKNTFKVTGIISTTLDIKDDIPFEISKVSQFQGVKKYIINTEVKSEEILNLIKKYPRVFFALSFKGKDFELKVKAKPPKSGSSNKKDDEETKADFCTLKTDDKDLLNQIFFDVGLNWKEAKINHTIKVENIIYPNDMDKLKPAQVRELSKREGILIRNITLDDKKQVKEAKFIA